MSNTSSIGNFYVDHNGVEQPIVYVARDLVNRPAPDGYHWEMDARLWKRSRDEMAKSMLIVHNYHVACMSADIKEAERPKTPDEAYWQFPPTDPPVVDAYICVKNA